MKNINLLLLALTFILAACSKTEIKEVPNGAELNLGEFKVKAQFYAENMVRVTKWSKDGTDQKISLVVLENELPSLKIDRKETSTALELSTEKLSVSIDKKTGNITYSSEYEVLKENGLPEFTPAEFDGDHGFAVKQHFELKAYEGVYGLGQHQYGYFNYRGKEVKLVQSNTDAVNPFLISTENYGILWDNYSMTVFNDDETGTSISSDMGNNIDYYFILGDNMDQVISGYRHLTGTAPMYGKYAYGYWQSKEHYDTQEELLEVARKYRKLKIPIDNMIQDWDYWNGAENWSGMFFDSTLFPEPEKMMEELHAMNYHAIISIWPALGSKTEIYRDMDKHGFLYPPVGWAGFKYYDVYNPDANLLYWKYLKEGIYSKGLDGWWIDSTEPDVINALSKEATNYELKKMGSNHLGSFGRYLNTFSLAMTDDIYKFWRAETIDKRAFILTRSCFAGQQRNAATTWSGDIGANWEIYRNQISAGLNHCMAGIPYWTFDIGSFVIGSYGGVFNKGGQDPAYQEFYTRMFQLGTFSPIFRSHGSDTPREMWEMGKFMPTLVKFDNLRYRLLPYIYSQAWKVTNEDYTIMRGLPMDFSADKNTYNIDDQFMFGPSMMVCPVTQFMYHRPSSASHVITQNFFQTKDGKAGLQASYYKDNEYKALSLEQIDPGVDIDWYGGRPDYVTDSMYSIRWVGKLVPTETGKHQFHLKSFDTSRIKIDGKEVAILWNGNEKFTDYVDLEAGKSYDFVAEVENKQTGAARMNLLWKTPTDFAEELKPVEVEKTEEIYLPAGTTWYDFWTGKTYEGEQNVIFDAPIDKIPLLVSAGSIIPMGPFVQYSTEKPADPLEIRIYTGADGSFQLYEDENDNYNYEKGIYSTIDFNWDDAKRTLTIGERQGEFPGMLKTRTIQVVLVDAQNGGGIDPAKNFNTIIEYKGEAQTAIL
ncbi:MAG: TIM-barrel domain-containing protein [Prolixibacteraceae bacterium]